jgi:hypothetical protein
VDYNPIVIAHARTLLTGEPGTTDYIHADLRDPAATVREAARTLDFGKPVAIMPASPQPAEHRRPGNNAGRARPQRQLHAVSMGGPVTASLLLPGAAGPRAAPSACPRRPQGSGVRRLAALRVVAETAEEATEQPALSRQRRGSRRRFWEFPPDGLVIIGPRDGVHDLRLVE